jgi:hypothetical protein
MIVMERLRMGDTCSCTYVIVPFQVTGEMLINWAGSLNI